ncbi:MAG: carbohydrate ABC transporter permease [Clostridia bacterium]|jgi:binding-protein-dependent transport system inner membrane component|uniref:Carbohydrate ABC transporter permease n=1 Tax=Bianquea renquensis TaxID=2763661 RepID=A0A926DXN9_9FIRM|nr:carbohydrate ABC transporter permease [Bianquea renquensis]MBC8545115.1 carbohydrate ABC transporter permease [Bianquea renquensis]
MKREGNDIVFQVVNYIIFGIFALICVYPFYYIVINTISANDLVDKGKIVFFPRGIHFSNYVDMLQRNGIARSAVVSVLRTVLGTGLSVLGASYMAFCFTKQKMWAKKFWYRFVVVTMYFSAGMIPVYLNIKMLGLLDTFWVYIIPGMFPVYNMILVKTFMESIPPSLEESAEIDGAGFLTRYFRIALPLSLPIIATVALFSMVGQWNSFMDTLLYIRDYNLYTLQYILYEYLNESESLAQMAQEGMDMSNAAQNMTPTSMRLTITVIVTLPIMLVYPFMQRYFVEGIMIGAVKG